jgi:LysR family transcriptional regulator, transcription activator of glutamate synthase operon
MLQSIQFWNSFKGVPMEMRQIQYFLSIVDTGSFLAAADEHFISQSSLSKMIISLEKELAVSLFDRSKRKVSLTEAGEAFLRHARVLAADYKATLVEMDGYKHSEDFIYIAAIPVLPQYGIATSISQFRDKYPHIRFNLVEIDGLNIIPALKEHRFDLAFARHNYLDDNQFDCLEISQDKLILVVSKNNRFADRTSISLKELANDNFIVFDRVTELHRLILDECAKVGFEPTIFYSSHRKVSVIGLVTTNIGIALMPVKIYEYYRHPDVVSIPLDEDIQCNIVLLYLKNRQLPKAAMTFLDFMLQTVDSGKQ